MVRPARRRAARTGLAAVAAAGAALLAGCQPTPPPAEPAVRGLRLEVGTPGPIALAVGADLRPAAVTATPPELVVTSTVAACQPLVLRDELRLVRRPWRSPDGADFDAWWLEGGRTTVVVPGAAECLPGRDQQGTTYVIAGVADVPAGTVPVPVVVTDAAYGSPVPAWAPRFTIVK